MGDELEDMSDERNDLLEKLKRGKPEGSEWPDYVDQLGLTLADAPLLQELMLDMELNLSDVESEEVWIPLHAWRALAQLPPYEGKFDAFWELLLIADENDDDWALSDFGRLMVSCGSGVLDDIDEKLKVCDLKTDDSIVPLVLIENVPAVVAAFTVLHPEIRDKAIKMLVRYLRDYKRQTREVNGLLASALIGMRVREAYALIEKAYMDNKVDHLAVGSLADIQQAFGIEAPTAVSDAPSKRAILDIVEINEALDLSQKRTLFVRSLKEARGDVDCPACGHTAVQSDMAYLVLGRLDGREEVYVLTNSAGRFCLTCPAVIVDRHTFEEQFTEASSAPSYTILGLLDIFQIDNADMHKSFFDLETLPLTEFVLEGRPGALTERKKSYVRKRRFKKRH
jgi:hypothetical protein